MPHVPARLSLALLILPAVAACGASPSAAARPAADRTPAAAAARTSADLPTAAPSSAATDLAQRSPATAAPLSPLATRLRPDVLVTGPTDVVDRLRAAPGLGTHSVVFRTGAVILDATSVSAVGVDPANFRAYAAQGTAEATGVWQAVARGEAVASHALATRLHLTLGQTVSVAGAHGPAQVRLGALATTGLPGTDLMLRQDIGASLGLAADSGVLLTAGQGSDALQLADQVRSTAGPGAAVDVLTPPAAPVAFLTGSAAAKSFGAFSYRYFADGTIQPDATWVKSNIVTAQVPILGTVTCHRVMLKQLRGALGEVQARGLAGSLHTYNGCYVPRFIERNPDGAISLHTWGIAIDLDAATNYRGIKGTMDPQVVAIFKRWGFRWGGDWAYTDPMHFELGAVEQ